MRLRAQEIPLQKESSQNETHFQEKEMFMFIIMDLAFREAGKKKLQI